MIHIYTNEFQSVFVTRQILITWLVSCNHRLVWWRREINTVKSLINFSNGCYGDVINFSSVASFVACRPCALTKGFQTVSENVKSFLQCGSSFTPQTEIYKTQQQEKGKCQEKHRSTVNFKRHDYFLSIYQSVSSFYYKKHCLYNLYPTRKKFL